MTSKSGTVCDVDAFDVVVLEASSVRLAAADEALSSDDVVGSMATDVSCVSSSLLALVVSSNADIRVDGVIRDVEGCVVNWPVDRSVSSEVTEVTVCDGVDVTLAIVSLRRPLVLRGNCGSTETVCKVLSSSPFVIGDSVVVVTFCQVMPPPLFRLPSSSVVDCVSSYVIVVPRDVMTSLRV